MAGEISFLYKTQNNTSPKGKSRVYFSCHPGDFELYFDKICDDIFKWQDCAIYYTEDMNSEITDENNMVDLERMHLFVFPVTLKMLSEDNRARNFDLEFAKGKNIPILPVIMEPGLDALYKSFFGDRQYLCEFSQEITEIGYEKKLKDYLSLILVGKETSDRIRRAFDAYVFLSYRKKDRKHANELMKLIHENPEFRDIAIWFDEFLTPGEDFKENIDKILDKSKMFTLLVTPNLLEKPNGKPNFVMAEEYPAAVQREKEIFPAEMVKTDFLALKKDYPNLPKTVTTEDAVEFRRQFANALNKISVFANNNDPEHNYLIGLAYLEGIDVEVDVKRGVELITVAAEAGMVEAMTKLYSMYHNGDYVDLDWKKATLWCERVYQYYCREYGEDDIFTSAVLNNLTVCHMNMRDYQKALKLGKKSYNLAKKLYGKRHANTIKSLSNLSIIYGELGDRQRNLEIEKNLYLNSCDVNGEKHIDTITILYNLAICYAENKNYDKAIELKTKAYNQYAEVLGEKHQMTIKALHSLATTYFNDGKQMEALELYVKDYMIMVDLYGEQSNEASNVLKKDLIEVFGEQTMSAVCYMHKIAISYEERENFIKAIEWEQKAYGLQCQLLGEEKPSTIFSLTDLAFYNEKMKNYNNSIPLFEKVYKLRCKVFGKEKKETIGTLRKIISEYLIIENYREAVKWEKILYKTFQEMYGEKNPKTMDVLAEIEEIEKRL